MSVAIYQATDYHQVLYVIIFQSLLLSLKFSFDYTVHGNMLQFTSLVLLSNFYAPCMLLIH